MKNSYALLFALSVSTFALRAQSEENLRTYTSAEGGAWYAEDISRNGQYVAVNLDNLDAAILDVELNTLDIVGVQDGSTKTYMYAVSDNGIVAGCMDDNAAYFDKESREWVILPMAEGYASANVFAISSDATVMAGYMADEAWTSFPCVWKGLDYKILPLPEKTPGNLTATRGKIIGMSADASILVGAVIDDFNIGYTAIWRAPDYDVAEYVAPEKMTELFVDENFYMTFGEDKGALCCYPNQISDNGKWITGQTEVVDNYDTYSFRYNIETKEFEVLRDLITEFGGGAIDNDGNVYAAFSSLGIVMMGREPYIQRPGHSSQEYGEYLLEKGIGINLSKYAPSCTFMDVNGDASLVAGFGLYEGEESYYMEGFLMDFKRSTKLTFTSKNSRPIAIQAGRLVLDENASDICIYDLAGNQVYGAETAASVISDLNNVLSRGVYIVKALVDDKTVSAKYVVK